MTRLPNNILIYFITKQRYITGTAYFLSEILNFVITFILVFNFLYIAYFIMNVGGELIGVNISVIYLT